MEHRKLLLTSLNTVLCIAAAFSLLEIFAPFLPVLTIAVYIPCMIIIFDQYDMELNKIYYIILIISQIVSAAVLLFVNFLSIIFILISIGLPYLIIYLNRQINTYQKTYITNIFLMLIIFLIPIPYYYAFKVTSGDGLNLFGIIYLSAFLVNIVCYPILFNIDKRRILICLLGELSIFFPFLYNKGVEFISFSEIIEKWNEISGLIIMFLICSILVAAISLLVRFIVKRSSKKYSEEDVNE